MINLKKKKEMYQNEIDMIEDQLKDKKIFLK